MVGSTNAYLEHLDSRLRITSLCSGLQTDVSSCAVKADLQTRLMQCDDRDMVSADNSTVERCNNTFSQCWPDLLGILRRSTRVTHGRCTVVDNHIREAGETGFISVVLFLQSFKNVPVEYEIDFYVAGFNDSCNLASDAGPYVSGILTRLHPSDTFDHPKELFTVQQKALRENYVSQLREVVVR
jgi:hypothetical protein